MPDSLLGLGSACSTATSGVGCTSLGGGSREYVGIRVRPRAPTYLADDEGAVVQTLLTERSEWFQRTTVEGRRVNDGVAS